MKLNHVLKRFLQFLCGFTLIAVIAGWIQKDIFHRSELYWYPFISAKFRFNDFTIFQEPFKLFHQRAFFESPDFVFAYPAPAAFVYQSFFSFGDYATAVFLTFCVLVVLSACVLLGRAMHRRSLGVLQAVIFLGISLMLAYPFWYLLDRANIEIVNWLLVALGVTAYWEKKWYLAATMIGVAMSLKIFPFVFLALLISERKYLATAWGVFVGALSTVTSTWFIGPSYQIASKGIAGGLAYFRLHYVLEIHNLEIGFDHSIFAIIKEALHAYLQKHLSATCIQEQYFPSWLNGYMLVAAILGLVVYFGKIRHLPRPNQILALTIASILLPPVSYEYTLMYLYIPWAALVLFAISSTDARKVPGLIFSFACLAFLLTPETYISFRGLPIAGQLKALVLMTLFVVSVTCPFRSEEESGVAQGAGAVSAIQ
jgi:hypothetical protein